ATGAQGIHLTSEQLNMWAKRPDCSLVAASCHSLADIERANHLGVDFIVLSPVHQIRSHSQVSTLGWWVFQTLVDRAICPVYALGSMQDTDLETAWSHGAQGIAAISAWMAQN
ncbi:MAG: thiamine phosphate synthase, partial [Pseudomonadota bacterium]